MAITIKDLQPREVWKHFEALTQVPRPSGHLEKVQEFLIEFGKSINVETWKDEAASATDIKYTLFFAIKIQEELSLQLTAFKAESTIHTGLFIGCNKSLKRSVLQR